MEAPPIQRPIGLLDLPAEIKNRIYRFALTSSKPLYFNERFPRKLLSPHLLRCCKTVCQEATAILYAENAFIVAKPGDMTVLRTWVRDTVKASLIKNIVFSCQFEQGQDLINKTRLIELRWFRGLESIVIEEQLYEKPRRKIGLKDALRKHRNFESVKSLVTTRPEVRIIYRAWYHGKFIAHVRSCVDIDILIEPHKLKSGHQDVKMTIMTARRARALKRR